MSETVNAPAPCEGWPPSEGAKPDIHSRLLEKWQRMVDLVSRIGQVTATLVMRADPDRLTVLVGSNSDRNPFTAEQGIVRGGGSYCERVIEQNHPIHIPDASQEPGFELTPAGRLGFKSYYGLPLRWPDGEVFGTICSFDRHPNAHSETTRAMLQLFQDGIENDLQSLFYRAQQERAEALRAQTEARFRRVIEHMPVMMCAFDNHGRVILWNQECVRVTGYDANAILHHPDGFAMLVPEGPLRHAARHDWASRSRHCRSWRWDIRCRDGTPKTIVWHGMAAEVPIEGWATWGVGMDITEEQRATNELRYRLRFESLLASLSTAFIDLPLEKIDAGIDKALNRVGHFVKVDRSYVFLLSPDGRFMTNTHEWCAAGIEPMKDRIQDLPVSQLPWFGDRVLKGHPLSVNDVESLPPEAENERAEWLAQKIQSLVCVPIIGRERVLGFVGFDAVRHSRTWHDDIVALLRLVGEMIGNAIQHQRVEGLLRERERTYETLLSNLPGLVYRCRNDAHWTAEFLSDGCEALTGYKPASLLNNRDLSIADLIFDEDREAVQAAAQAVLAKDQPFELTYRIRTRDGHIKWVWEQGQGLRDETGNLIVIEGFITDITDRREAEMRVFASERKLRQIIDLVPHFIFAKNRGGRFLLVNQAIADAYGTTVEKLTQSVEETITSATPAELEHFRSDDLEVINTKRRKFIPEETITHADGSRRILQTTKIPFTEANTQEEAVLGVAVDITAQKWAEEQRQLLEEQLRQSQKLEAVGTLASGVAHDFNNLITVMMAGLRSLRFHEEDEDKRGEAFDMVDRALDQASGLVHSLLTFSRKAPSEKQLVEVREVIDSVLALLRRTLPSTIEIKTSIPQTAALHVHGDVTQLQQVLMNLVINARDAMPDGGDLHISLDCHPTDNNGEQGRLQVPPPNLRIRVRDHGCGIDEEDLPRIFEPFFSTKPREQGTGLGLALIDAIVKDHGGQVLVDSTVGQGSTFTVVLPWILTAETADVSDTGFLLAPGEGQRIVLMEPSEPVHRLVSATLRDRGYGVEAFQQVEPFLRRRAHSSKPAALYIIANDLPRASGLRLLADLRGEEDTTPAIILMNIAERGDMEPLPPDVHVLPKPFKISELKSLVAELLAAHA